MTKIAISDVEGRSARDVMHPNLSTVAPTATSAEVEAYFAASSSRRLAAVADGARYVGAIGRERFAGEAHGPDLTARELVHEQPTVAPDAPAAQARDHALAVVSQRCPVVDGDGRLLGVVAVDKRREGFCGADDGV
jgi:CBS domain-containing protein